MVASFDELMAEQARAAVKVTGAHHSSWNRRVETLSPDDPRWGLACWDHTIKYHPEHVIATLQDMFNRAGQQHDDATLHRYREALRVVLHENIHLLTAAGTSHAMGFVAYDTEPAHEVLDEATTELAAQNMLNKYIAELGLEAIAPGISTVDTVADYREYTPAVERFARDLGVRAELAGDEVIRQMSVVNAEDKFGVAAELLYEKTLSAVVPDHARTSVIGTIVAVMRPPFATIHGGDANDPQDVRFSALAGFEAARSAGNKADELATFWSANQDLRRSLDAGLVAGPPGQSPQRPGFTSEAGGQEPASSGKPDHGKGRQTRGSTARDRRDERRSDRNPPTVGS